MMGSGKSTVGSRLAARLGRPFFDTDAMVEAAEELSVGEVFASLGESAFRLLETEALGEALRCPVPAVIAVGGGAVVDPSNRSALHGGGHVVWLRARPETLAARVGDGGGRPLLAGSDPVPRLRALADDRRDAYTAAADLVADVDGLEPEEVVELVVGLLA